MRRDAGGLGPNRRLGRLALWTLPTLLGTAMAAWLVLGFGGDAASADAARQSRTQKVTLTRKPAPTPAPVKVAGVLPVYVGPMVVLGYNDLGMHCMNDNFDEICILPPYNNLHAQVIARGEEPRIVTRNVTVKYNVPGNTYSAGKTNFWVYAQKLFGVPLKRNIGLTGNTLTGAMKPMPEGDWAATGIPITPVMDNGRLNAYPISNITVTNSKNVLQARTVAVVPVSSEIHCDTCHVPHQPGSDPRDITVAANILLAHDRLHPNADPRKNLINQKPVLCASCHADPALGTAGLPGVTTMSGAMHTSHAERVNALPPNVNKCYACHPGFSTDCLRDVHKGKGMTCIDCHDSMTAVGSPNRKPWIDEPKCGTCHQKRRPTFAFEEPGKLFKQSRGHHGVMCASCHGSPHAVTPAVTPVDNLQVIALQGKATPLGKCSVCHKSTPDDHFDHKLRGDD